MGRWLESLADLDDSDQPASPPPDPPVAITREWFTGHGIGVLHDDLVFIRNHLPTGTALRNQAIRQYVTIWQEAMAQEPLPHCRQNAGRFQANTWLRCAKITTS